MEGGNPRWDALHCAAARPLFPITVINDNNASEASRLSEITSSVKRVAAFAEGDLTGNPAGVYLCDEPLPPPVMQSVAAAIGYAETAFITPVAMGNAAEDRFAIRYFTPVAEVPLCGHATLASAFVLWETGEGETPAFAFTAPGGRLTANRDPDGTVWLDFPSDRPGAELSPAECAAVLGSMGLVAAESVRRAEHAVLVQLADERKVTHYQPDAERLREIDALGVIVTAPADPGRADYDFVSRFFAPRVGVDEDPVTGIAHTILAPYWSGLLGREMLTGYQASDRGGIVRVIDRGDRTALGGKAKWIR